MTASIKDVARFAKVVPSTVSLVLNNKATAISISAATRQRIMDAVEKLGYQANPMARSLRTKKTGVIGVVANSETFREPLIKLAENEMIAAGYEMILSVSEWNTSSEETAIQRLLRRHVDGILILSPSVDQGRHELVESLSARQYPFVTVGPSVVQGVEFVDWDRKEAYLRVTRHVLERGCRKIAFLGMGNTPGVQQRIDGIQSAIQDYHNATFVRLGSQTGWNLRDPAELCSSFREYLRQHALEAVICYTDYYALLAMKSARDAGLRIPADIAVTGCGNTEWSAFIDVPLTTIQYPGEIIMKCGWQRLQARIEKGTSGADPFDNHLIPAEPIFRQSSMYQQHRANK